MRTFRSARFRVVLAATLWLVGAVVLAALLVQQAADPAGQYAFDFQAYHAAAGEIAAGRSPYAPEMFSGPIPAQGAVLYKYPPVLAQLLVPLAGLSMLTSAAVWLLLQGALILAGVWLAARAGGAPRSVETFLWCGVAATFFLPSFDTLWKGNVSGVQAFQVALMAGGAALAGGSLASAALLKTTPAVMFLPALAGGRRLVRGLLITGLSALAVSVLLSPQAWLDFVRVVPNLVAGPAVFPTNVAPDSIVALAFPEAPVAAGIVRVSVILLGLAAILLAVMLARRPGGWQAALTLALAASLILPSSIWYHYLAVLLPIAALAWSRAGRRGRVALVAGGAMISFAVLWLPLAVLGGTVLVAGALFALWPRPSEPVAGVRPVDRGMAPILARLRELADDPNFRHRALLVGSALGYAIGLAGLIILVRLNGGLGYDSYAYWLAGRNVLEGQPLYWLHDEGALGAYRYPPLFAQLWAPFALLPALVFSWAWRIVCLLSLRYLAGSWRNVGLWLLVPFTLTELSIANVTFPVAAMTVMALNGRGWMASWAGAVKFGPLLLLPYLWFARPSMRRSLVLGVIMVGASCAVSFTLAPDS
ncbi:MAG: DUF2029 domain-containing protein, partial [Chloroflexota bacterium]|nr:DUF2029 domain-containing protein [Chloroflexota bacterium]